MTSIEHNSGATCVVHGGADFARAPRASQPQVWGRVRLVERKRHAAALGEFSRAPPLPAASAVVCSTAQETLTVLAIELYTFTLSAAIRLQLSQYAVAFTVAATMRSSSASYYCTLCHVLSFFITAAWSSVLIANVVMLIIVTRYVL